MTVGSFKTIKKRPDFVRLFSKGRYVAKSGLVVQAFLRPSEECEKNGTVVRIGFTATKKIGNAVVRNRCKRRLRALVAQVLPKYAVDGADYNFIARAATPEIPFERLEKEANEALYRLKTEMLAVKED